MSEKSDRANSRPTFVAHEFINMVKKCCGIKEIHMVYNSVKDTSNPFLPKVQEMWKELLKFEGNSFIEKAVKSISILIVLFFLVCLVPIGLIISIYNSFYNLQKKAYYDLRNDTKPSTSQFVSAVEFGIYALLSLPFLLLLIPYWIFAIIITWFAKHWIKATIFIVIILFYLYFMDEINHLIKSFLRVKFGLI